MSVRVLLVDDQALLRSGFRMVLEEQDDIEVVGEAADGDEAVGDYAKLTIIGIVAAGIGWPVIARLTSDPRWVFLRLAFAVTAVLLLPDLYIWLRGQPGRAVLVLVMMHLTIGLMTYNLLVRLAPVRPSADGIPDYGPPR